MRIWQIFSVQEQLKYGESPTVIANSVGLPSSAVNNIKEGGQLANTLILQYEKDINRCPKCGHRVKTSCYTCYREKEPDRCTEVIERPNTHKGFMLNVHLQNRKEFI